MEKSVVVQRHRGANRESGSDAGGCEFEDGEVVPGTQYRVVRRLGTGGMGVVYEVEHEELGKRFVLKALLGKLARRNDLVRRLQNEWRALGRLEHPNIVSVTDAGTSAGHVPFFVMERLYGETLAERLRRERTLSLTQSIDIAVQILDGLSAAHRLGIVHRDVKPPNIFLGSGCQVKILDFGIAKVVDARACRITGRGAVLGTPKYMAPEQVSGGKVDGRTDIYSVALVLYAMLTGRGPFDDARAADELLVAHLTVPPPRLGTFARSCPRTLEALVSEMLAKNPSERPSCAELAATRLREIAAEVWASSSASPPHSVRQREAASGRGTLQDATTCTAVSGPNAAHGGARHRFLELARFTAMAWRRFRMLLAVTAGLGAIAVLWAALRDVNRRPEPVGTSAAPLKTAAGGPVRSRERRRHAGKGVPPLY